MTDPTHPLNFPRPGPDDAMVRAARAANVAGKIAVERSRRPGRSAVERIAALEERCERLEATIFDMVDAIRRLQRDTLP
jgi:hypothetical protein